MHTHYFYNGQLDSDGQVVACAPGATLLNGKPLPLLCKKTEQQTADSTGERGFSALLVGAARAWEYSYNSEGKLLKLTGPSGFGGRSEIESRSYYTDTTDTHTAGDLESLINSVGEVTEFLEYSPGGSRRKFADLTR
jgi:hypothetical protein